MARAITTKASERRTRGTAAAETPKRKPGRPAGSTNAKKIATPERVGKAAPRRGAASAPPAPKLNKAELELHVSKLERTVARLREKNKELKQAANDAREHADSLEEQLNARPAAPPAAEESAAPKKSRRRKQPPATPPDGSEDDLSS